MGCNVTSIYGDQVIGKIFYPDQILNDLRKRDFCKPFHIKDKKTLKQMSDKIITIYGFNQSFCQGYAFSTVIEHNQFLVYNNGRFIIKALKSQFLRVESRNEGPQMSILPHEDQICAMDVNKNMCVVGLSGGKLVLWDLKFNEIKVQIRLPNPSSSFSSISLTKKYIFATDTSLPNNIGYCFDIQTTKLKGCLVIDSLQPTLKGIRFQDSQHVILSAEGLWFFRYSATAQALQLTKGMFTTFPKTSQCSITVINDQYLVSGGVDGYIYIWNNLYRCIKVIKCLQQQSPITAIAFSKTHSTLILGSLSGKIKCYSFGIKLRGKKNYEDIESKNFEKEEEIQYLLTQALDEDFGIQNIVSSQHDTLMYFSLHCRGAMTSHLLPSSEPYPIKIRALNNLQMMRFSRKGDVYFDLTIKKDSQKKDIHQIQLINVYPSRIDQFNIDRFKVFGDIKWLKIENKSSIKSSQINRKYLNFYTYSKINNSIAFVSQNFVVVDLGPIKTNQFSFGQQIELKKHLLQQSNHLEIMEISPQSILVSLNYLQIQSPQIVFLIVTFEDQCNVFQFINKKQFLLHTSIKFIKNKFNNFKISPQSLSTKLNTLQGQFQKAKLHDLKSKNSEIENKLNHQAHSHKISYEIQFDQQMNVWKLKRPIDQQQINSKIIEKNQIQKNEIENPYDWVQILQQVHCSYVKAQYQDDQQITIGGSSIIFWNLQKSIKN